MVEMLFNVVLFCISAQVHFQSSQIGSLKMAKLGFRGGAVVGGPPAGAGDAGSHPGPGGSHVPQSGWAREPRPLSLRVRSLCSTMREATAVRGPRTAKTKTKQKRTKLEVSHSLISNYITKQ